MAISLIGGLRYIFTGSEKKPDVFKISADGYEIKGKLSDKDATLFLRDFVIRECFSRGYCDPIQRKLFDIFNSGYDLDDCGGTD